MLFKNANIFVNGAFQHGSFRVEDGKFAEILDCVPAEDGIDLAGQYVIPGLVDVHNHGNSNADFSDGDYAGVQAMAKYQSNIDILFNGKKVNGKSIMQVMTACIKCGAEIEIQCSGSDEEEMLNAAGEMIQSGLGDEI